MKGAEDQRQLNNVYRIRRQLSVEHSSRMSVEHSSRMSVEYSSRMSVEYSSRMSVEHSSRMSVEHSSRLPVGDSSMRSVEHDSVMSVGDSSVMSVEHSSRMSVGDSSVRSVEHDSVMSVGDSSKMSVTAYPPDRTSTRLHFHLTAHHWLRIHPTAHSPDYTSTRLHIHLTAHPPDYTSTWLHIHPTTHPLIPLHIHWRRLDEELDPVSSCNTSMVQKSLRVWKHPHMHSEQQYFKAVCTVKMLRIVPKPTGCALSLVSLHPPPTLALLPPTPNLPPTHFNIARNVAGPNDKIWSLICF